MLNFQNKGADFKRSLMGDMQDMIARALSGVTATIAAQKDGTVVADQHRVLNFQGAGVSVADDPSNRRINVNIVGTPYGSSSTTIVSSTDARAISLWTGSTNTAPPTDWETPGFDDSGWANAVGGTGNGGSLNAFGYVPSGADTIWPQSTTVSGEQALIRQAFTLPAGAISAATIEINCDDVLNELWINGTQITVTFGHDGGGYQLPATVTVPPGLLVGGENVIAGWVTNIVTSGGHWAFIAYKLTAAYSNGPPAQVFLGADSALTASVWTNVLSITLSAGTWLILAKLTALNAGTDVDLSARITDGTTVYDSSQAARQVAAVSVSQMLGGIVLPSTSTTYSLQGISGSSSTAKAQLTGGAATGTNATWMLAIRVA